MLPGHPTDGYVALFYFANETNVQVYDTLPIDLSDNIENWFGASFRLETKMMKLGRFKK